MYIKVGTRGAAKDLELPVPFENKIDILFLKEL